MAETELYTALLNAQAKMPALVKDSENPHFGSEFISLKGLLEQVLPVLREEGLLLLQPLSTLAGGPALTTTIAHLASGTELTCTTPLLMAKEDAQGHASSITYMRRYSIMSLLGLVAAKDDDDGNGASKPTRARAARRPQAAAPEVAAEPLDGDTGINPEDLP